MRRAARIADHEAHARASARTSAALGVIVRARGYVSHDHRIEAADVDPQLESRRAGEDIDGRDLGRGFEVFFQFRPVSRRDLGRVLTRHEWNGLDLSDMFHPAVLVDVAVGPADKAAMAPRARRPVIDPRAGMAAHAAMEPSLLRHELQLDDFGIELNELGLLACPTELDGSEETAPPQESENLDHQVLGRLLRAEPIAEVSKDRLQARGPAAGPGSPPGIVATNPVRNLDRIDIRERVPQSVRGISLRLGDPALPLGFPEKFRAGWVSRVVSEHVAGEGGPHAELVEEHQEDVLQTLGRDAESFHQLPTLGSHVLVEAMVSDPR